MKKYGIVNWKKFDDDMRRHGMIAEGFIKDIYFGISEHGVGVYNDTLEVWTGRMRKSGSAEYVRFTALNRYEFNDADEVINELKLHYDGLF